MIDTSALRKFSASLRRLSAVAAIKVAEAAAPALTEAAKATFTSGQDAFGIGWTPREDGTRATLVETGALANGIRYVASGTKLRVALGVRYAKYVLGPRPAFPRQGDVLPASYSEALAQSTQAVCSAEVSR